MSNYAPIIASRLNLPPIMIVTDGSLDPAFMAGLRERYERISGGESTPIMAITGPGIRIYQFADDRWQPLDPGTPDLPDARPWWRRMFGR